MDEKKMTLGREFLSNLELDKPHTHLTRYASLDCAFGDPDVLQLAERAKALPSNVEGDKLEMIPQGRFSKVYTGFGLNDNKMLGIKAYHALHDQEMLEANNPDSELYSLFKVSHPCILKHYGIVPFQDRTARLIEYIPRTLYDEVLSHKEQRNSGLCIPEDRIKNVLVNVASALEYLHARQIVHGNLHFKNIFIDGDVVKISDLDSMTLMKWSSYKRTPWILLPFLAPELSRNRMKVTPECDIWSLGVCLHVMATGMLPFGGNSFNQIVKNIRKGLIAPPITLPVQIQTLLAGMFRVKPLERFSLEIITNNPWTLSAVSASCYLKRQYHQLQNKMKVEISVGTIKRDSSKQSVGSSDEGYTSAVSADLQPSPDPREDRSEEPEPIVIEKKETIFAIFLLENNREEYENVRVFERCKLQCGTICIKIYLPMKEVPEEVPEEKPPTPTTMERFKSHFPRIFKKEPPPPPAVPVNVQCGDYALMSFGRNSTAMVSTVNLPTFKNRKEAHTYFCKQDAQRLWASVQICVCSLCKSEGTTYMEHDDDFCLYKLLHNSTPTDEIVFNGEGEDSYNIRLYNVTYNEKPIKIPKMIRFCMYSKRVARSGCTRIMRKLRRQPASSKN